MKTELLAVGVATVAAILTTGTARGESPGGRRFDPGRPFEVFADAPADAVALTPQTISNDLTKVVRVRSALDAVSADDLERWRTLRVDVLAELPREGARTNAVKAYLQGYAGLVAAPSADLAEGLKDVAALARLNALAHKVKALRAPDKVWLEGRRGLFQIESVAVAKDDPDLTRLNAYARIRRLAAFAKEPEGLAFDLNLPPRPPLVPKKLKTKRREGPSKAEIENALWTRSHFLAYDAAVRPWENLAAIAREEALIGFPDPGVPTCCWRDAENERLFVERRLEIVRRRFGAAAEGMRCASERGGNKARPPKILSESEQDQKRAYQLLPEMDQLAETVVRMRIEYMLDRLNGREIKVLPPPQKKAVELTIEEPDGDVGIEL